MTTFTSLDMAGRQQISTAVTAAEATSAGEIVTILSDHSNEYTDVALLWSVFAAFLALAALTIAPDFYLGLYDRLTGGWVQQWHARELFALALTVAVLKFTAMWLLQLWQPLRLFLVPTSIKNRRVREKAITCFKVGAEQRTTGRTGILIYLSMREHRAEIVADEAIASIVAPEVWGDAMAAMLVHIREGRIADGMVAAVERVGVVLAEHFPRAVDDKDELPNRLIEV
jgi:putative membrane protein